jgi:raffinose/stachyose/melibiose transport system permease protein
LGLRDFYGEFSVNVPGIMAALVLGTLPLLIAYFISQEKVVKGLAAGAVKG